MKKQKRLILQQSRKALGLSQEELAKVLGVTKQHLSDIENGKKDPSLKLALKIAKLLNGTVEFFFDQRSA